MGLGVKKDNHLKIKKITRPVILNVQYDLIDRTKEITYLITNHNYDTDDKFINTVTKEKTKKYLLNDNEINNLRYEKLMKSIKEDTSKINLDEIKNKEDVINYFSFLNISNTEKNRRAIELCKRILREKNIRYVIQTKNFV